MTLPQLASVTSPYQISMFGVDEAQERQQAILAHAVEAIQHYIAMRDSAMKLCLSLFHCRQQFEASGEGGWGAFCEANFASLGLSQGNIRSAVRAGSALARYIANAHEKGEQAELTKLESLSRSALIVLGEAPDDVRDQLIERVSEAVEMRGSAVTAREVEQELERLRREKSQMEEDLREARGRASTAMERIDALNNLVRDRESRADQLQMERDRLQHQLKSSPHVVVEDMDPRSKAAMDARRNLECEVSQLNHELTRVQAELGSAKGELDKISRQALARKHAANAMEELEQHVARLKAQWSDAYAQKIRAEDPHTYGPVLTRIANDMRFLADQLDPTLV